MRVKYVVIKMVLTYDNKTFFMKLLPTIDIKYDVYYVDY